MDIEKATEAGVKAGAALAGFVKAMGKDKTRSRLAAALGVEDRQEFICCGSRFKIENDGWLYTISKSTDDWMVAGCEYWIDLFRNIDRISPCPVWSEELKRTASIFAHYGNKTVQITGDEAIINFGYIDEFTVPAKMFDGLQPGQTVPLSEIK